MGEENVQEDWKGSGTGKWAQLSFIFLNLLSQVVITLGDVIFYDKEQQNLLAKTLDFTHPLYMSLLSLKS